MRPLKALILLSIFSLLAIDAAAAATMRIPLKKLAPIQDHQQRGSMDDYSFTLPIPARWKVQKATLHFTYVNSSALIPRTSRLIFTVHDQPLAQVKLNPDTPEGEVTVPIPGAMLKTGYNPCKFWVSQHLLMHAMSANAGGQIGSVIAAAVMLSVLQGMGIVPG